MRHDAFSQCHPAVNFLFFAGAISFGVVFQHPAFLLVSVVTAAVYYLLLSGKKGMKLLLTMVPVFMVLTGINPLFNTQGEQILFMLLGRPYTWEALQYGMAVAAVFIATVLWFGCYNKVMTSDKFTSLFGNWIPALSLLLVMVFRLVPNLLRKARQITDARNALGKGNAPGMAKREKLQNSMTVAGALVSWALEDSVITGDAMRARGYGVAKRSSFRIYTMRTSDWVLLGGMVVCMGCVIAAACCGQVQATYTPQVQIAPVSWGIGVYGVYLLIPTVLQIKEAIQWCISRSRI